jgi:molecular chaperone DnaJ
MVERPKKLSVKIPRGVHDGSKVRVAGQGGPGQYGGQAGDLFLIPHIIPNARFDRKDDDLYTEVPVTFPEAALGAEIEVPTLTGVVTARVPAGTSSGQSLRLRGKGMPHVRREGYGDLYVKIRVTVPKDLSERERELIEELQRLRRENPRAW